MSFWPFKKKRQEPEIVKVGSVFNLTKAKYQVGGGWGDSINISSYEGKNLCVHGWKQDLPRVGDLLFCEFTKEFRNYIFTNVRPFADPPDMFSADLIVYEYATKETDHD